MRVADTSEERRRPQSLGDIFISFTLLALQGFGGVISIAQRELVEKRHWLTREEFVEDLAVAQIMPGPNIINLSLVIGDRYFGWRGALLALAGILTLPLFLVLLLAFIYAQFSDIPGMAGALRGMGAVAAGLISGSGLRLIPVLRSHPIGQPLCIVFGVSCFVAIAFLRWPLVYVLLGIGVLICALTYRRLAP